MPDNTTHQLTISLNNNTSNILNNNQISFSLDTKTLIAQGLMKADGGDIRLLDSDKNTLLDYWIDPNTLNTSNTQIYLKVPDIQIGGEKIYLNYGDLSQTSLSNQSKIFSLYENFDDGTINTAMWSEYDNATNYIQEKNGVLAVSGGYGWGGISFVGKQYFNRPMVVEFDYKHISGNYMMFGLHDNGTGINYDSLVYANQIVYDGNGNRVIVHEDGSSRGDNKLLNNIPTNIWQTYKIEADTTGARYYQKLTGSSDYTLFYTSSYSSENNLTFGFSNYNDIFELDNIKISNGSTLASNTISPSQNTVYMSASVDNANKTNLTYNFYIDLNKDGDFTDGGESIGSTSSSNALGAGLNYNINNMNLSGTYNTKVTIKDSSNGVQELFDKLSFISQDLSNSAPVISGLDAISSLNTNYNPSHADESINLANKGYLASIVNITDSDNNITQYSYQVDNKGWISFSDKASFDKSFNNIYTDNLTFGEHTLTVKVADLGGAEVKQSTNFTINTPPQITSFDSINSDNSTSTANNNIIASGTSLSPNFSITDINGQSINYQFQVKDINNNIIYTSSDFADSDSLKAGISAYNTNSLNAGEYKLELIAIDSMGEKAIMPDLYNYTILQDKPIAYYKLSETSGTVALDSSGNNYNGTYMNSISINQNGLITDTNNKAVKFDGINDYIEITNGQPFRTQSITIETWINPDILSNAGLVMDRIGIGGTANWSLELLATGNIRFSYYDGSAWNNIDTTNTPIIANTWSQISANYDNGTVNIYANGNLVKTQSGLNILRTDYDSQLQIGRGIGYYSGLMDDVAIYDKALTGNQIQEHYLAGRDIKESLPISNFTINSNPVLSIDAIEHNVNNIITSGGMDFTLSVSDTNSNIKEYQFKLDNNNWSSAYTTQNDLIKAVNQAGNTTSIGEHILEIKAIDKVGGFDIEQSNFELIKPSDSIYETAININSSSNLTDYQFKVTVDTESLISNGKMRFDAGDLRILDTDKNTYLDYWIEEDTINTNKTNIYIKAPTITSGGDTVYLQYGDSSLKSMSDGTKVFSFFDDFNDNKLDASKWLEADRPANYITQNGELNFSGGGSSWGSTALFSQQTFNRPIILEFDYQFISGAITSQSIMGIHDSGSGASYTDLVYSIDPSYNAAVTVYEDGSHRMNTTLLSNSSNLYQKETYKIEVGSSGAKYYQKVENGDYTLVYTSTYSTENNLKVGFTSYDQAFSIDNVRVYNNTAVSPTIALGSTDTINPDLINTKLPIISGLDAVSGLNTNYNASHANETSNNAVNGYLAPSINIQDNDNNISNYAYKLDNNNWSEFSNKTDFENAFKALDGSSLNSGKHTLFVKLIDGTGLETIETTSFTINTAPVINNLDIITNNTNNQSNANLNIISNGTKLSLSNSFGVTDSEGDSINYGFNIKDDLGNIIYTKSNLTQAEFTNEIHNFDTSSLNSGTYYLEHNITDSLGTKGILQSAYQDSILEDKPVGYWRLGEDSGSTAFDIAGNNKNGIYLNGVSLNQDDAIVAGGDGSVSFDRTNDYIQLSNLNLNTTAGAKNTVEFWMNWDGNNNTMPIGFNNYDLNFTNGSFGFNTGSSDTLGISSNGLANKWVYVTAVFYNGTPSAINNELYIDGVKQNLIQQGTPTSRTITTDMVVSGWTTSTAYKFGGKLDELAVYNKALSASDIQEHYLLGKSDFDTTKFNISDSPSLSIDMISNNASNIMNSLTSYTDIIKADNPLGYWKLGETSGTTVFDSSVNNINATYTNGVVLGKDGGISNSINTSANFDGINDYITAGNNASFKMTSAMTLEAWINPSAITGTHNIVSREGEYLLSIHSNGNLYYAIAASNPSWDWVDTGYKVQTNEWTHLTFTTDSTAGQIKLYANGNEVYTRALTGNIGDVDGGNNNLMIGARNGTSEYFKGQIDEVAIYNTALSANQIKNHYLGSAYNNADFSMNINDNDNDIIKYEYKIYQVDSNDNIISWIKGDSGSWLSSSNLQSEINKIGNGLGLGEYKVEVQITDSLGNTAIDTDKFSIVSQPIISGLDAITKNTFSDSDLNIAQAGYLSPSVQITDSNNTISEYAYKIDNNAWNTFTTKSAFDTSFNAYKGNGLASGEHNLSVKVVDGGTEYLESTKFIIDTAPKMNSLDAVTINNSNSLASTNIIAEGSKLSFDLVANDAENNINNYQFKLYDSNNNLFYTSIQYNSENALETAINDYSANLGSGQYKVEINLTDASGFNNQSPYTYLNNFDTLSSITSSSLAYTNDGYLFVQNTGNVNINIEKPTDEYVVEVKYIRDSSTYRHRIQYSGFGFTGDYGIFDNQIYFNGWTNIAIQQDREYTLQWHEQGNNTKFNVYDDTNTLIYSSANYTKGSGNVLSIRSMEGSNTLKLDSVDVRLINSASTISQKDFNTTTFTLNTAPEPIFDIQINTNDNTIINKGSALNTIIAQNAYNDIDNNISKYQFKVDGGAWSSDYTNINTLTTDINNSSINLNTGLHNIEVKAIDTLGLEGINKQSFTIIDGAPVLSNLTAITNTNYYADSINDIATKGNLSASINITDTDNSIDSYSYKIDNGNWQLFTNKTDFDYSLNNYKGNELSSGLHTLSVQVSDRGGLYNTSNNFKINTAPIISSLDPVSVLTAGKNNITDNIIIPSMNLSLSLNASDSDGSISNYQFMIQDANKQIIYTSENYTTQTDFVNAVNNYNTSGLGHATYTLNTYITDNLGELTTQANSFTTASAPTWLLNGFDAIDNDKVFGSDTNINNKIPYMVNNQIFLVSDIQNTDKNSLNYQFQIDTNHDGVFENIGIAEKSSLQGSIFAEYNPFGLAPGDYNTKLIITDNWGYSQSLNSSFNIYNDEWSLKGLDSIDNDGIYGGLDSNINNLIDYQTGTSIKMVAGINNPFGTTLTAQFQIDSNNDGVFENIGSIGEFTSKEDIVFNYNPQNLAPGTYNTKVIVADETGKSLSSTSSFTIADWSITGLDSIDTDGVYGGLDGNPTDTINLRQMPIITLTAGINNIAQIPLTYQFQIDTNNDGIFENIGTKQASDSISGLSKNLNIFDYAPGTYNTKVIVTDIAGTSKEISDQFTIAYSWGVNGLDSIDNDGIFGGTDSNTTNTFGYREQTFITLTAGIDNTLGSPLTYKFQIDSNNDGAFENIGVSQTVDSKVGSSRNLNVFNYTPGTYNTKVIVTDMFGGIKEANNQFTITYGWDLLGFDAVDGDGNYINGIDSNSTNTLLFNTGQDIITMSAGVSNSLGIQLNYEFQIDKNKDGIFETFTSQISNSQNGATANYNIFGLSPGDYDTRVLITDPLGNIITKQDQITIDFPWSLKDFDPVLESQTNEISFQNVVNSNMKIQVENTTGNKLFYEVQIDSNHDGVFERIENIQSSTSKTGIDFDIDTYNLNLGNYAVKVIVSDDFGRQKEINEIISIVPIPWNAQNFDAVKGDSDNIIPLGTTFINLQAELENLAHTRLNYQFQIDSNNDGIFENIDSLNSTTASGLIGQEFYIQNLGAGTYQTRLIVNDFTGRTDIFTDSFTIKAPSILGFDAIDNDLNFANNIDTNSNNIIAQGSKNNINLLVGIENTGMAPLKYTFEMDTNHDGKMEIINSFTSNQNNNVYATYNPYTLGLGIYDTKVTIEDLQGNILAIKNDSFEVAQSWTVTGFDAVDSDGIFGGNDTQINNIVYRGDQKVEMVVGVDNPYQAILNYQFQIDSNQDGIFENIGAKQTSTNINGIVYNYNSSALGMGTYNTRVVIGDSNGINYKLDSQFEVINPEFKGLDALDFDGIYGGSDTHTTNIISQGASNLQMATGVNNIGELSLKYVYEMDLTDNGINDFIEIGSSVSNQAFGDTRNFDLYGVAQGNYQAKVTVFDLNNNLLGTDISKFTVGLVNWTLDNLDPIANKTNNIIVEGYDQITFDLNISNNDKMVLNYQFQIDTNHDGIFENIGSAFNNYNTALVNFNYTTYNLDPDTYNTKVIVSDILGNTKTIQNSFEIIENNWNISNFDSITDNSNNTINQGKSLINLESQINNTEQAKLNYQFQIDTNQDGIFENIGSSISSSTNDKISTVFNTQNLSAGIYNTKLIVTDVNGDSISKLDSFEILAPTINSLDAIKDNANNTIYEGLKNIIMQINLDNPEQTNLKYSFFLDKNDGNSFISLGNLNSTTNNIEFNFDPKTLNAGEYSIKALITDNNNQLIAEKTDNFTILENNWSLKGFDAVDTTNNYNDAIDNNTSNIVSQGSNSINFTVGVDNINNRELTYKFQIDSNNDGIFENINISELTYWGWHNTPEVYTTTENTWVTFNASNLSKGEYNIKAIISDTTGHIQEKIDTILISGISFVGFDSIEQDGIYGGNDSHINNEIVQGYNSINLTAGVINSGGAILNYQFQIDTNNDGIFENISTINSGNSLGTYTTFNTYNLAPNTYKTQISITDQAGNIIGIDQDEFTVKPLGIWDLNEHDSISNSANNIILENHYPSNQIHLNAQITNTDKTVLSYQFQIDSNNDGIFENIGSISKSDNSSIGTYYNISSLAAGDYNTKVIVSDILGNQEELMDSFSITPQQPIVKLYDAIQNNDNNIILQGEPEIKLIANTSNPAYRNISYQFQIDSNNDGIFENIGNSISNASVNQNIIQSFNTENLSIGTYNTKVLITDNNTGNTTEETDQFIVNPLEWKSIALDSIDKDGIYGGVDSNINNTIPLGNNYITLSTGIENKNATLTYQFFVDLNQDGDFEDNGELIGVNKSDSLIGNSIGYNTSLLSSGEYNTKVIISDRVGREETLLDSFTITNPEITSFGYVDKGNGFFDLNVEVNNIGGAGLVYYFQLDYDGDSIFENNIYENIGYSASNTKEGLIREFNASNLINNTYTIQVIIKDIQGNFIDQAISTISII